MLIDDFFTTGIRNKKAKEKKTDWFGMHTSTSAFRKNQEGRT